MKKRWGSWVLLLVVAFVVAAGGCGGGGDDGDNGDKTFSDLPTLPPAPATSGAWADAADTSWYGEDQSAFTISTAEQLAGLSKVNRSGLYGKTVTLANDIDLAGREWTPVWIENFNFDGGGRTVSNMTITSSDLASLFYGNTDGIIKNVNLTNVYIDVSSTSSYVAGSIAALNNGTVENCTSSGVVSAYIQRGFSFIGGVVGQNNGKIDNCTFSGSVFSSSAESSNPFLLDTIPYAGGIVGVNYGEVLDSSSNGKVSYYPYQGAAGGIAGSNGYVGDYRGTVTRCKFGSDVSSYARGPNAGGGVGENYSEVFDSSSSGGVSSYNSNNTFYAGAGGIVARNYGRVENCFKTSGKITITNTKSHYAFAGGIIGASETEAISGNTFSRAGTDQQWGIGSDIRGNSSNDGATPID